jgi:hypothetical protein
MKIEIRNQIIISPGGFLQSARFTLLLIISYDAGQWFSCETLKDFFFQSQTKVRRPASGKIVTSRSAISTLLTHVASQASRGGKLHALCRGKG